ncbi:MAG: hypothetical protein OEM02_10390 [Desulfobulbaceae bacterium]|nr:hypothetical protein [Desulfobulbaceae bacterium]
MRSNIPKKKLIESVRKATTEAVKKAQELGCAITYQSGKKIVKKHPDGQEEVLEILDRAYIRTSKKSYKIG